mmetsp:Transcript_6299/g.10924  ORF Transcript_6299/g.10924 Transcript_6299/m.10924 type:complete len:296 (-) Transcript_6299:216-1103(-)|eukprot:CAMPEP_0204901524 /NCGR_PEP_ID=MMETSP1397-20131031/3127_1 /ASSEMBLY_ACC=CAM_ASM_000891 /TAXON_ID=49980 /ORGANISM="Climacostomum Climacostomum virens, Strain Stock W-24" /LENGTH=295 /DNA_ID=CAMNT_0052069891 /DNA_START=668 /DNA_END=1555 /DNA_ORIENTATION=+
MDNEVQSDEIWSVTVVDYKVVPKLSGFVEYKLNVVGTTNYLHQMAYFDRNACVTLDKPVFMTTARYSALLEIHTNLLQECKGAPLPDFPPKRWVRNKAEGVIRDRIGQLNRYFSELLSHKYVRTSLALTRAFNPKVSLQIAVVGCPNIGKTAFLEGFVSATPSQRHSKIEVDPDQSQIFGVHRPIDLVVDKTLVRIKGIDLMSLKRDFDIQRVSSELARFDSVILAYAGADTQYPVQQISKRLTQPFSLVNLGSGDSYIAGSESADYRDEAYNVFEQLIRRCLNPHSHRRIYSVS